MVDPIYVGGLPIPVVLPAPLPPVSGPVRSTKFGFKKDKKKK